MNAFSIAQLSIRAPLGNYLNLLIGATTLLPVITDAPREGIVVLPSR